MNYSDYDRIEKQKVKLPHLLDITGPISNFSLVAWWSDNSQVRVNAIVNRVPVLAAVSNAQRCVRGRSLSLECQTVQIQKPVELTWRGRVVNVSLAVDSGRLSTFAVTDAVVIRRRRFGRVVCGTHTSFRHHGCPQRLVVRLDINVWRLSSSVQQLTPAARLARPSVTIVYSRTRLILSSFFGAEGAFWGYRCWAIFGEEWPAKMVKMPSIVFRRRWLWQTSRRQRKERSVWYVRLLGGTTGSASDQRSEGRGFEAY